MDEDKKNIFRVLELPIQISSERRQKLMEALSSFVATTSDELETIVPLSECRSRLQAMTANSKKYVPNDLFIIGLKTEAGQDVLNEDIKPIKCMTFDFGKLIKTAEAPTAKHRKVMRLSQALINKMKMTINMPPQVKPTLPIKKLLIPSITKRKQRGMIHRRFRTPMLGRPFPKRRIPVLNTTVGNGRCDELYAARKSLVIPIENSLSVIEDMEKASGGIQVKKEPLDSDNTFAMYTQ